MHYTVAEQSSLFAHMALTKYLSFYNAQNDEIHWRAYLNENPTISSISDFRNGIEENLKIGVIKYIFDVQPQNYPDFLKAE